LILFPFSIIYGFIIWFRNVLFNTGILRSQTFQIPVIIVGNITAGGTGKTPHIEYLIRLLKDKYSIAVLSRGYRRKTGNFFVASAQSGVSEIGDEPLQIKLKFPEITVAVDRDRVNGIKKLIDNRDKPDIVLLDDAYQHRYVQPGLSVLLIDFNRPIFNDFILPAGDLRESKSNIDRANIILITKCSEELNVNDSKEFSSKLKLSGDQKLFYTCYSYGDPKPVFPCEQQKDFPISLEYLQKKSVKILLVTGIANPRPLRQYLKKNIYVADELVYPDHFQFTEKDLHYIKKRFNALPGESKLIFTTEKDAVRLKESGFSNKEFFKHFYYIPIEVKFLFNGERPFNQIVDRYLKNQHVKT